MAVTRIFCRSCGQDKPDAVLIDLDQQTGVCGVCASGPLRWHFDLMRYVGTDTPMGHRIEEMFKAGLRPVVARDGN